jgi:hypothetical protein
MPFVMFKRQDEFIQFLYGCYKDEQNGLVEKSREQGATWGAVVLRIGRGCMSLRRDRLGSRKQ